MLTTADKSIPSFRARRLLGAVENDIRKFRHQNKSCWGQMALIINEKVRFGAFIYF